MVKAGPQVPSATRPKPGWRRPREHLAVALALMWWAGPLTDRIGGRGPWAVSFGLVLLVPALLLVRPWNAVPPAWAWPAWSVGAAALGVCALSPTGWSGANDATSYSYSVLLALVLLGYLRNADRRQLLAILIMVAGIVEFAHSFPTWTAGGDPGAPMTGSFFWWNPFAAFLLAPGLLGLAAVTWAARPARMVGVIAFPLATAGIVLSTSRATMACLAVGTLGIGAFAASGSGRVRRLATWTAMVCVAWLALLAVTGPPFFSHRHGVLGGTAARSHGETLADNGGYRLEFWQEALTVAAAHPLTGGGFHSMGAASQHGTPASWARSNLAHNGYLQVMSDGGLLLAVPFLGLVALCGVGLARVGRRAVTRTAAPVAPEHWLAVGAVLSAGGLLAHSAVDFDWSHPADLAMTGIVIALALSLLHREPTGGRRHRAAFATALVSLLVASSGAALAWDHVGSALIAAERAPDRVTRVAQLEALAGQRLSDYRVDLELLRWALPKASGQSLAGSPTALRAALRRTARLASQDRHLSLLRARVLALLGDTGAAIAAADVVVVDVGRFVPPYADELAHVYTEAGRSGRARAIEAPLIGQHGGPGDGWPRVQLLQQLFGAADPLTRCAAGYAGAQEPPPTGLSLPLPLTGKSCDLLSGGVR